ncbi:MAG: hypothetical protein ACFCVH_03610 [Alphaproteobacteria bacterium]
MPFRLAGGGLQFGLDGAPAYEGDHVCFECKRYTNGIPREQVLSKIAEISIRDGETDLWILCATTNVPSQLEGDVRKRGWKDGIATLVLDWSETEIPPLAAILAMARATVEPFLRARIEDSELVDRAAIALGEVPSLTGFDDHVLRLRRDLQTPSIALAMARKSNTAWLTETFSDRSQARHRLGQPLSPGEAGASHTLHRDALIQKIRPFLEAKPDGRTLVVLGEEGNGKSWIVARSWLALQHKPLLVFMSPELFDGVGARGDIRGPIIDCLIAQTADERESRSAKRWRRRFTYWEHSPPDDAPRLVILVDGINQRPKSDWARVIENLGAELDRIGGRLIVTSRTVYFRRLENRLTARTALVPIPEWTVQERDQILAAYGVAAGDVHPRARTALRNPRLLGLAIELLSAEHIKTIQELDASRLLFEHMRANDRDAPEPQPVHRFASELSILANEVLCRVTRQERHDLTIFEGELQAVAHGRFFLAVAGEPELYQLADDGLTLALGFSVIRTLLSAHRNGRDLTAKLQEILEPIAALDRAAEVILAALTVASHDDEHPNDIATALIAAFAETQNPDQAHLPVFAGLVGARPEAFMNAACQLCLAGGRHPNFDWIEEALRTASTEPQTWPRITALLPSWLARYSLSPERRLAAYHSSDPQDKVRQERERLMQRTAQRLAELSPPERAMLKRLTKSDGDLGALSRLALRLLAGWPIAPFAQSLVLWALGEAISPAVYGPDREFADLIQLNRRDWPAARAALLEQCATLRQQGTSTTGQWALVRILRATGLPADDEQAAALAAELNKGRDLPQPWRLLDDYCDTDPCDPDAVEPLNIESTAERYAAIDVGEVRQSMSNSAEDHFFVDACTCLARFKPAVAIAKHHELAEHTLIRSGIPLRQALFELRPHSALIPRPLALKLIEPSSAQEPQESSESLTDTDQFGVAQYRLLLAFPHLSGEEQIETLLGDTSLETVLLDLMNVARPLDQDVFARRLNRASEEGDERAQFLLLAFAKETSTPVGPAARARLGELSEASAERVRTQALGIIADLRDPDLLSRVAAGEWRAPEDSDSYEPWYGSFALLQAAKQGLLSCEETLDRISPRLLGRAVAILGPAAAPQVARRVDAAIRCAAGFEDNGAVPDIELNVSREGGREPLYDISDKPAKPADPFEALNRFSETNAAFEQRQQRNYDAFVAFRERLTEGQARIILDHIEPEEFDVIVDSAPDIAERWYELFVSTSPAKLPGLGNLVLLLARSLTGKDPNKAAALFTLVRDTRPFLRVTFGQGHVPLSAMAAWAGPEGATISALRADRLDRASNDHELALEVLAALRNGNEDELLAYIDGKLQKATPVEIARALMVAGFADQNRNLDDLLDRYNDSTGLPGRACRAALYAYKRNIWAKHWFGAMCDATDAEAFWSYSILFLKIVDGRFDRWRSEFGTGNEPLNLFGPSLGGLLRRRIKKWDDARRSTLFGEKAPDPVFLAQ